MNVAATVAYTGKSHIGLTTHGDAVLELQEHITPGALIADDAHPCISTKARAIPGCLVEALVLLRQPGVGDGDFFRLLPGSRVSRLYRRR